tara:strand:+ start:658 stop:1389 length:732 start_codon:yes stop_codon:yes gene_type:complete
MSILLHGDCLELMKEIDDESVDFIFCDLPYGQTSLETNPWDIPLDLNLFWKEILRIKKLRTPIFFTTTTKYGYELLKSQKTKCPFRYDLIWKKSACVGFLLASKMPLRIHEMVYVFYEKLPYYNLADHKYTEKKSCGTIDGNKCYGGKSTTKSLTRSAAGKYDPPLPNSLLEVKSTRKNHSTEKPVALMEWLLNYYSKEGDTVFDPTMGSGSTGVACKNMNRNFIGIEKDEEIFNTACERLDF